MCRTKTTGNLILFRVNHSNILGPLQCWLSPAVRQFWLHKWLTAPQRAVPTLAHTGASAIWDWWRGTHLCPPPSVLSWPQTSPLCSVPGGTLAL